MTLLMVFTVAITGIVTISLLRNSLIVQMDQDIDANAQLVTNTIGTIGSDTSQDLSRFYGVWLDSNGNAIRATHSSALYEVPKLPLLDHEEVEERDVEGFTVPGSRGESEWRVMVFPLRREQSVARRGPSHSA